MPFNILGMWFRGLLAIAIVAAALFCLRRWYVDSHVEVATPVAAAPAPAKVDTDRARIDEQNPPARGTAEVRTRRVFRFDPGWNRQTGYLAAAIALLAWACAG